MLLISFTEYKYQMFNNNEIMKEKKNNYKIFSCFAI